MRLPITLIIPFRNIKDKSSLENVINSIINQTKLPNELIVIFTNEDSGLDYKIQEKLIQSKIKFNYYFKQNAFPGEARNLGINHSHNEIIGFLDHNTIPEKNWLEYGYENLLTNKNDIVIGQTKYITNNFKEKIILSSTMGFKKLRTLPGTILYKKNFFKCGLFLENIRSGEDGDWFRRVNMHKIKKVENKTQLSYDMKNIGFKNIFLKWKTYYIASSHLDQLQTHKQIYLISLITIILIFVYNWNFLISEWNQNSDVYVHHITKKTIFYLSILYIFFRSIYLPMKKGVSFKFLFPINFILILLVSLVLDSIKSACLIFTFFKK